MTHKDIQLTISDRVARISMARPPLNILTISMMKEMNDAIIKVATMKDICAIVLAPAPGIRAFSAGVAIEEHKAETVFQMLNAFHSVFRSFNAVCKPVVALVPGAALGGGCELVAFADIVIATQAARFGQPEIKIGVFPPVAACLLPRVIGEKKARELILTGELLTADEAHSLGLVNHVVPEPELESKAATVLEVFRQMSVPALESARRAIAETSGLAFDAALKKAEDIYLNKLMSFKDPTEGIQAFIDKRAPAWRHR